MTNTLTTQPAGWESIGMIWALLPIMVILMVLTMVSKISMKILEPEVIREIRPVVEEVALAKAGAKVLPAGRG